MQNRLRLFIAGIFFIAVINLSAQQPPKREMRAVWIATVANIDFPSRQGLTTREQQAELLKLLDTFRANRINTVIFQVRPTADVFYPSAIEPWSVWLSGRQGVAPEPFYDPLAFLVAEAHRRCMEVHVWLNPYRALNGADVSQFNETHIFNSQRNMFFKYGEKYYFDPGLPETRTYLNRIVAEIVQNYDIDAVHFDDYFYPYPVGKEKLPDAETFKNHSRGFANINDWRRDNVTQVIRELRQTIKTIKPWVDFGVSPFGIWRNRDADSRGSATKGTTNYDDLYADIVLWSKEGYIDYVAPQLYWEIGKPNVDYRTLLDWWNRNCYRSKLYIGLYASGLEHSKGSAWQTPNELVRQIRLNRRASHVEGEMFFSAKYFVQNMQGLNDSLQNTFYKYPALTPPTRTKSAEPSAQPQAIRMENEGRRVVATWQKVSESGGKAVAYYVVYAFKGKTPGDTNDPKNIVGVTADNCLDITDFCSEIDGRYTFTVTSVNKYRLESEAKNFVARRF